VILQQRLLISFWLYAIYGVFWNYDSMLYATGIRFDNFAVNFLRLLLVYGYKTPMKIWRPQSSVYDARFKERSKNGLSQSLINNAISWFLSLMWIMVEIHFYYNSKIIKQSSTGIRYLINFSPLIKKMSLNQSNRRGKISLRFDYSIIDFYEISGFKITISIQTFVL
jgi:hypothetical protein